MEAYKRIKQYIEENGLKQTYVAEKAGIGIGIFNSVINGNTKLTVERLEKIAKALDKPVEFFLNSNS